MIVRLFAIAYRTDENVLHFRINVSLCQGAQIPHEEIWTMVKKKTISKSDTKIKNKKGDGKPGKERWQSSSGKNKSRVTNGADDDFKFRNSLESGEFLLACSSIKYRCQIAKGENFLISLLICVALIKTA